MSHSLRGVQPHEVDEMWDKLWPFIQRASVYAAFAPLDEEIVRDRVANGLQQLWYVVDDEHSIVGAFLTEIYGDLSGKTLELGAIGGNDLDKWLHHLDYVMKWGHNQGCERVVLVGRDGWERLLSKYGFKKRAVVLERSLDV